MALEIRLGDRARSTRDLDLALRDADVDGTVVRELVIDCLSQDQEADLFEFRVGQPTPISPDDAGRPGWRFPIEARLGGQTFAKVRMDVVARDNEISKTQHVELPGILNFVGLPVREVEVVDPEQHFAEKVHALTRAYGDRPNSRVRDLPDLVLLIEDGLEPSQGLLVVVSHVFAERATHELPRALPEPPAFWRDEYPVAASDMDVSATTLDKAMALVRGFWTTLLSNGEEI